MEMVDALNARRSAGNASASGVSGASGDGLPTSVLLELEPRSESAFCRVHSVAHNPFVRIEVASLQSLRHVIEHLENKWKSRHMQFVSRCRSASAQKFIFIKSIKLNT